MRTLLLSISAALVAVGLFVLGGPATASAQDDVECHEIRPGQIERGTQTIYGHPHGPQGALLIPRARERYEPPPLVRRDMPHEVRRSVRREIGRAHV